MTLLASLVALGVRPTGRTAVRVGAPPGPSVVSYRTSVDASGTALAPRLVLLDSTVTPGRHPVVAVTWRIEGGPTGPRPVLLVLERRGRRHVLPFHTDETDRADGTSTVTRRVRGMRGGAYRAYLSLPSPDPRTRDDPRLALRAANAGTWDAKAGLNALHQTVLVG